jgi:hypothetical protein
LGGQWLIWLAGGLVGQMLRNAVFVWLSNSFTFQSAFKPANTFFGVCQLLLEHCNVV